MQQKAPTSKADKDAYVVALKRRYDGLKGATERANCESHWQEIGEVVSPRKVDFVGMRTQGEKKMNRVYDPTGIHANEMLAAGLHGMATNPSMKWFSLRMVSNRLIKTQGGETENINENQAVQQYLSDVEEIMWQRLYQPGTNFTTSLHESYLDLGAFGTGILFVGQRDAGGLLFEARSLAECVVSENAEGRVDTVFRKFTYTVRQMIEMEASDGWMISPRVKDLYRQEKYDEPIDIIHAVCPRHEREHGKKDRINKPWRSTYFEHHDGHLLEDGGFDEFPYLCARWSRYAGEIYGRSPAMTALPDIKMLQAMTLTKIKLMQKAADPVKWLRDDGVIGQTIGVPGGINYWRGNPGDGIFLEPVSLQGLQAITQDIVQLREQILRTFFADIMRMTDRANMTATEVVQRTSEQMRLFGPLIGRLESEMLGPLVERVFGILSREGLLPQPPKEIEGQEFTIEYVSPIATAQKQQASSGIVQVIQLIGMFGPDIAAQILQKNVDIDKFFRWLWDLFNNDPDLLREQEELEADNQKQQMAQQMQMAAPAVDMAGQGANALKALAQGAQAAAGGGFDIKQLIAAAAQGVGRSPKAKQQLMDMTNAATGGQGQDFADAASEAQQG